MTVLDAGLDDEFSDVSCASDDEDSAFGGHWMKISGAPNRFWDKKVEEVRKASSANWKLGELLSPKWLIYPLILINTGLLLRLHSHLHVSGWTRYSFTILLRSKREDPTHQHGSFALSSFTFTCFLMDPRYFSLLRVKTSHPNTGPLLCLRSHLHVFWWARHSPAILLDSKSENPTYQHGSFALSSFTFTCFLMGPTFP